MPPLGFLTNATGDPRLVQRRLAFQATQGVPPAEADFVDFLTYGGSVAPGRSRVDRLQIPSDGQPLAKLRGKRRIPGREIPWGDLDPGNEAQLMKFLCVAGAYDYTDKTTWNLWRIKQSGATPVNATGDPTVAMLDDDNVNPRRRSIGMQFGGFTLSAEAEGNLAITAPYEVEEYDLWGAVAQTVGSASDAPIFMGMGQDVGQDASEHYTDPGVAYKLRVDTANADNAVCSIARGAGVYSFQTTIYHDRLDQRGFDENGALIGPPGDPMRIYWPDTPTLVATDEFTVQPRRTRWTQPAIVTLAFPVVNCRFIMNGVRTNIEGGWSLAVVHPLSVRPAPYGEQNTTVKRRGAPSVTLTINRDVIDLELQKILHEATSIEAAIDVQLRTEIGASAIPFRAIFAIPALEAEGELFGPEPGAENIEENVVMVAGAPASAMSYDPGYSESAYSITDFWELIVWNDMATIGGLS